MWKHIESYINQHREELDRHTPPGDMWARIEQELGQEQRPVRPFASFDNWIRLAAAIVLIIGGAWLWMNFTPQNSSPMTSLLPVIHQIDDASLQWKQAEQQYLEAIEQLQASLPDGWEDTETYQNLANDLDRVEADLNDIREAHDQVLNPDDSLLNVLKQKQEEHLGYLRELVKP